MKTKELLQRLDIVTIEIAGIDANAKPDDKKNKDFEKRSLESELGKRNMKVNVEVISDEDWFGDEVKVTIGNPSNGKSATIPYKTLDDGESGIFKIPLGGLLPLGQSLNIGIVDVDGPIDADDPIGSMTWKAPYNFSSSVMKSGAAEYNVNVDFE